MKTLKLLIIVILSLSLTACFGNNKPSVEEKEVSFDYRIIAGSDNIFYGEDWEDAGVEFIVDGETSLIKSKNSVNPYEVGVHTVEYQIELNKDTYKIVRKVNVHNPLVYLVDINPGIDTVKLNEMWEDAGIAMDDLHESFSLTTSNNVNTSQLGTYEVEYILEDSYGNTLSIIRVVTVTN